MIHYLHKHIKSILIFTTLFALVFAAIFSGTLGVLGANYGEPDSDSFVYYKQKIESSLQDLEREFRVNNTVTSASLSSIRTLVQEAYIRLPDSGEAAGKNESLKKNVELYLDLAEKNKSSSTHVPNAASQVTTFINSVTIEKITGSITANPSSGNAPFTSSFLASAKDPSGVNIPDQNFIWWIKGSGGSRQELQRGPTLIYTFNKEGTYQVFLDVHSANKNKKGKTDVSPLTISQDIEVTPRLGNIILLINGVNISNLNFLKVNPNLGKMGLLFDATASRAAGNEAIVKTKWDFGNGTILEYDGAPIVERQLYINEGVYNVTLEITTNPGKSFRKQLQLLVRDPAAVIVLDKEVGYIGEDIRMTATSYLANTNNVEYSWKIQDDDSTDTAIVSQVGSVFAYKPTKVGQYLVTLTTRSPNGNTDSDTRFITIESRPPIINLDTPKSLNSEKPNTILLDASRTYDPDTKSSKNLSYKWTIDGEEVILNNPQKNGSIGTYTFSEKGQHSVSLTVINGYGKVATVDRVFDISSTLTVGMNIRPRAAIIGTNISFQARAPQARFYEWNTGDGSPIVNGTSDFIQHIYKKTGVYSASLSVKNSDGSEENTTTSKIYITDTDSPFALIDVKNATETIYEDSTACDSPEGAFVINRAEGTTIDAGNSINIDGSTSGLSYTWKYFDRIKTGPTFSETFKELGCFPIELTVRSERNGASHTSKRFIQIKNIIPKLTSIDALIDATKKDTQKVLVNVVANGARDEDGVITSYIWYYTTEADPERQNIRITQSPSTTFVLPNVTEKYYFGVILEDNDGARLDSSEAITDQGALLVANDDANINMPLISLNVDKTQALTDETLRFSASAKNILGNDITAKSEYYWDFDGDGRIDQKSSEPQASYTYKKSGRFNMKLKVVSNGTSNTKYQVIYVKNELKASAKGYRIDDMLYFVNTSRGSYDSATWTLGTETFESLYAISTKVSSGTENLGSLTVKSGPSEVSTVGLSSEVIEDIIRSESGITLQSYPSMIDDTITLASPGERLIISAYGNTGKEYIIDTDTKIDSDIDGIGDNDKDNKDSSSYSNGSAFSVGGLSESKVRTREIKITIIGTDNTVIGTKIIKIIFDSIPDTSSLDIKDLTGSGSEAFGETDKINLEKLQAKIRTLGSEDRIVFTQYYNILIENWNNLNDRTEGLLTLQKEVTESKTLDSTTKDEFSQIIDIILVGDAQATNEISVATRLIEGLISIDSPNRGYIIERIEKIKAHPADLAENKILGKEILQKIQEDSSISTENKILIKSQLSTIVNGGQTNISDNTALNTEEDSTNKSVLGFLSGFFKILLVIVGAIAILFLIGYIVYRISRGSSDMGFQDFLIDSIAHNKPRKTSSSPIPPVVKTEIILPNMILPTTVPVVSPDNTETLAGAIGVPEDIHENQDPLASIGAWTPPAESEIIIKNSPDTMPEAVMIDALTPLPREQSHAIPDWLKPASTESSSLDIIPEEVPSDVLISEQIDPIPLASPDDIVTPTEESTQSQDPLSMNFEEDKNPLDTSLDISPTENNAEITIAEGTEDIIPEWLRPVATPLLSEEEIEKIAPTTPEDDDTYTPPVILPPSADSDLPEWLKNAAEKPEESSSSKKSKSPTKIKETRQTTPKKKREILPKNEASPKESRSVNDVPDWLK